MIFIPKLKCIPKKGNNDFYKKSLTRSSVMARSARILGFLGLLEAFFWFGRAGQTPPPPTAEGAGGIPLGVFHHSYPTQGGPRDPKMGARKN